MVLVLFVFLQYFVMRVLFGHIPGAHVSCVLFGHIPGARVSCVLCSIIFQKLKAVEEANTSLQHQAQDATALQGKSTELQAKVTYLTPHGVLKLSFSLCKTCPRGLCLADCGFFRCAI